MTTPPTWRDLGRRARRLGVTIERGPHEAVLRYSAGEAARFSSWIDLATDAIVLIGAVATALAQMEIIMGEAADTAVAAPPEQLEAGR